ncbi:hypothetical protein [Anaerovibrio lipolyticus]|uniref:hypothetical protein n=1 Tax=Anaerovibrio lipolyticus TaxID=82374 RepID=UPI000484DF4F|nr:hypothetical protein [Anaerovibrio lipolyticus]
MKDEKKDYITQEEINDLMSGKSDIKGPDEIIPEEVLQDIDISIQLYGVGIAGITFRTKSWEVELNVAWTDRNPANILFPLMSAHFDGIGNIKFEEFSREPEVKCIKSTIELSCKSLWSTKYVNQDKLDISKEFYNRPLKVRVIKDVNNEDSTYEKHEFQIPLNVFCYAIIKAIDKLIDKHGFLGFFFTWNDMRTVELSFYLYTKALALKKYEMLNALGEEIMDFYSIENKKKLYYSDFREEMEILSARLD